MAVYWVGGYYICQWDRVYIGDEEMESRMEEGDGFEIERFVIKKDT